VSVFFVGFAASLFNTGIIKAAVFPVPVCAHAIRSFSSNIAGKVLQGLIKKVDRKIPAQSA